MALREALARELRQFSGLGAAFFRAAAARSGLTVTDVQVIDILDSAGPTTAGQLAEQTGLTTGAITAMLNRLEEGGLVRRERDPNDGRRVIVRLASGAAEKHETGPLFASMERAWKDLAAQYDDEQLALLVEFVKRSNALSERELAQLRETPQSEDGVYSAPLGDAASGRLVVHAGIAGLTLRAGSDMPDLFQARFEGPTPEVKAKDGVVTIRFPRRLWALSSALGNAEVTLSAAIPWQIAIQGGASEITAELSALDLAGLEVKGGLSMIRLELPTPASIVPIRISGGASAISVHRPAGVAARVHLKGWASELVFDEQRYSNLGKDVRMLSPGYEEATSGYDIEVASSASTITITAG